MTGPGKRTGGAGGERGEAPRASWGPVGGGIDHLRVAADTGFDMLID